MSLYEIIIACVAGTNLTLTLLSLRASLAKAATARLDALETEVFDRLADHDEALARITAQIDGSVTHDHLAEVYRDIKGISQQVHNLVGQQGQITDLLRQLLAQQLRH